MGDKFTDYKCFLLGLSVIIFLSALGSCYDRVYGHDIDMSYTKKIQQTIPGVSPFLSCMDETKPKYVIRNLTIESIDSIYPSVVNAISEMNIRFFIDSKTPYSYQQPNFETDENCNLIIHERGANFGDNDNVKTISISTGSFCGLAGVGFDDQPGVENINNGSSVIFIQYPGCNVGYVWLHEVLHSLGAVQLSAPNNTGYFHSKLYGDIMGLGYATEPSTCIDYTIDCYSNSYYNNGIIDERNYLSTFWNTANNIYLKTIERKVIFFPFVVFTGEI